MQPTTATAPATYAPAAPAGAAAAPAAAYDRAVHVRLTCQDHTCGMPGQVILGAGYGPGMPKRRYRARTCKLEVLGPGVVMAIIA